MNITSTATGQLVDRFGRLKAEAAEISTELDDIKSVLIAREGETKLEGELFRLAISHTLTSRTDWKAVALAMAKRAAVSDKVFENCIAANTGCVDAWVARSSARVTKGA